DLGTGRRRQPLHRCRRSGIRNSAGTPGKRFREILSRAARGRRRDAGYRTRTGARPRNRRIARRTRDGRKRARRRVDFSAAIAIESETDLNPIHVILRAPPSTLSPKDSPSRASLRGDSKRLVEKATNTKRGIGLEDLTDIRERTRFRKT